MREIEFRGKRVDTGEWVYGAFVPDALETPDNDLITWGFIRRYNRDIGKMETIEVARESVGQYTGLHDKNGKKIYEGDVLVWRMEDIVLRGTPYQDKAYRYGDKLIVRWLKSGFTLTVTSNTRHEPNIVGNVNNYDFWNNQRFFEVIGNAHDNPELLEATT